MVDRIFKFLSSIRLTVVLLCAGVLLVFVGTLAQVHEGLYQAQTRYFKGWFVWQPTIGDSTWPILLPGGYLIGTLLLVNLVAAHLKRFQLTWKKAGIHLIHGGLILLLLGQLLTDVLSRESSMRLSEGASKNYSEDFRANELALIDTSDPQSDRVISIPESMLAQKGEIGDSTLPVTLRVRHYWPNCEIYDQPPPQAIPVKADHGSFTNQMVLPLPADTESEQAQPAALVEVASEKGTLGTYLVQGQSSEEQIIKYGGKEWFLSMLFAPMLGGNQLILTEANSGGEGMINFPEAEFSKKTKLTKEGLPITLQVKEYWPKSMLYQRPGPGAVQPGVTRGRLARTFVQPTALVTDSDHRNVPAVVVEAFNEGKSLGSWLLWTATSGSDADAFTIGGKTYKLAFRFKRYYTPYSIGLIKFSHDKYKGTPTPKNFSSRIRLMNPDTREDREVLIKMNTPLRYAGTTYYQASFDKLDPHVSILQVVTNPGWLTPYFSCLLISFGLILQFTSHLVGFALKRRKA